MPRDDASPWPLANSQTPTPNTADRSGLLTSFGTRLRDARLAAGLSQSELGQRSGFLKPTLSRYENGHVLPSLGTLRRLAEALDISEVALLPDSSPEQDFYEALRVRGIEIHSTREAQELADIVSDDVERERGRRREVSGLRRTPSRA
jgi:transcriptional regulator with XRE-family HTH domain